MKITYDPEVDALYIRLLDEPVEVTTQRLSEEVAINYGPDGRVVGIEVLDASEYVFAKGGDPVVILQQLTAVAA
jgi:uncharacterized protein YuzE